jgi:HEAT repeat protein
LDYANVFNVFIYVMEIAVLLFAALALFGAVMLVVVRVANKRRSERWTQLENRWRTIFRSVFTNAPVSALPPVKSDELYTVLLVFNSVRVLRRSDHETANTYAEQLDDMALRVGLDAYALRLLERGDNADKIAALNALGLLLDTRALDMARELMRAPGTELSRAAAHCVLRLRPDMTDMVLRTVRERGDWVPSYVETMLRELGTGALDPAMIRLFAKSEDTGKLALLDWVPCCSDDATRAICRQLLDQNQNPEILAGALRALASVAEPPDNVYARRFADHSVSFVRLAALRLLRAVGTTTDQPIFEKLLADSDYWVRRRAAETFVYLSHGNSVAASLATTHTDPFARAALSEMLAVYQYGRNGRAERRAVTAGPKARK